MATTIRKVVVGSRTLNVNANGQGLSIEEIRDQVAANIDASYANASMNIDGDTLILSKAGGTKG